MATARIELLCLNLSKNYAVRKIGKKMRSKYMKMVKGVRDILICELPVSTHACCCRLSAFFGVGRSTGNAPNAKEDLPRLCRQ